MGHSPGRERVEVLSFSAKAILTHDESMATTAVSSHHGGRRVLGPSRNHPTLRWPSEPRITLCADRISLVSFAVYSFLTIAGLWFVYDANKTRPILFAFALLLPWVDLPGFRYQIYSLFYAAMTFGPPHGNGKIGTYVEWSANLGTHVDLRIAVSPRAIGAWDSTCSRFSLS